MAIAASYADRLAPAAAAELADATATVMNAEISTLIAVHPAGVDRFPPGFVAGAYAVITIAPDVPAAIRVGDHIVGFVAYGCHESL